MGKVQVRQQISCRFLRVISTDIDENGESIKSHFQPAL